MRRLAALLAAGALLAGCASADKNAGTGGSTTTSGSNSSSTMPAGMNMGGSTMNMSGGGSGQGTSSSSQGAPTVDGIKPVPTQTLGTATWQGMKITAMATTPLPFVIFNGTHERMVKPPRNASFHLMVMLNDAQTDVTIPYASVWATISQHGKVIYDDQQWPMISRYMGPHYGNDVSVPGAGTYQLSLLISPPVSARHVEYQNVWLKPHRVNLTFHWKPIT